MSIDGLPGRLGAMIEGSPTPDDFDRALALVADEMGAVTATLHRADATARMLLAVASRGLPDRVKRITAQIPFGKGMAGLCAERAEPVAACNLQTDQSGAARPLAKETGVAGAIVVPAFASDGTLRGTLGVGKPGEHDYDDEERAVLTRCAATFAEALDRAVT